MCFLCAKWWVHDDGVTGVCKFCDVGGDVVNGKIIGSGILCCDGDAVCVDVDATDAFCF